MQIAAVHKFSLSDFPSNISAILFTKGCNFLCPFCHNGFLLENGSDTIEESEVFSFLESRIGKLSGVVISGGEPTLQEDIIEFIQKVRSMGFNIKLDTNGSNPCILKKMIDLNLLDYIAMDIKLPIDEYKNYTKISDIDRRVKTSIDLILSSDIDYEFRTTTIEEIHSLERLRSICSPIKDCKRYILQDFVPENSYIPSYKSYNPYKREEREEILSNLRDIVPSIEWRG